MNMVFMESTEVLDPEYYDVIKTNHKLVLILMQYFTFIIYI